MAKFRTWISGKLRSGKNKGLLNKPPNAQDNPQRIFSSASVQAHTQTPAFPSTRNLSKESIPARLPIPEDNPQETVSNHQINAKQPPNRPEHLTQSKVQEVLRRYNNDAEQALKWAVHTSDDNVVSHLLSMSRLANIKVETYQDCFIYADYHSAAMCKILIAHALQDSKAYCHILDLDFFTAIMESRWARLDYFLNSANQNNKQLLLHSAIKFDRPKTAEWLLQNGVSADTKDAQGKLQPILPLAVEICGLDMVKLLVDHGADLEAKFTSYSLHGYNALLTAAARGSKNKTQYLLDCGADIEATDGFGRTPLHVAAKNNYIDVVRLLLDRGASHVAKSNAGKQPIHLAGDGGHAKVFNMLREHAGLPSVTGSVHYPNNSNRKSSGSRQTIPPSLKNEGKLWPDQVIKDQKTGEKYVLTAADSAYWN